MSSFRDLEQMRTFETGATRSSEEGKLDFEGYLSPLALTRFAKYMRVHSVQADGKARESDNWQKGIPLTAYMKSMWRHFMDVWAIHRGWISGNLQESLCALMFNVMGYLHELCKEGCRNAPKPYKAHARVGVSGEANCQGQGECVDNRTIQGAYPIYALRSEKREVGVPG